MENLIHAILARILTLPLDSSILAHLRSLFPLGDLAAESTSCLFASFVGISEALDLNDAAAEDLIGLLRAELGEENETHAEKSVTPVTACSTAGEVRAMSTAGWSLRRFVFAMVAQMMSGEGVSVETLREAAEEHLAVGQFSKTEEVEMTGGGGVETVVALVGLLRVAIGGMWLEEEDIEEFFTLGNKMHVVDKKLILQRMTRPIEPSMCLLVLRRQLLNASANEGGLLGGADIEADTSGMKIKLSNLRVRDFFVNKAACVLKKKGTIVVKDVHFTLDHDFELEVAVVSLFPVRGSTKYLGSSEVSVSRVEAEVELEFSTQDKLIGCRNVRVKLGAVTPTIRLKNGTLISEMVAHGVLDYFAESLTQTIEAAATTALDDWAKDKLEDLLNRQSDLLEKFRVPLVEVFDLFDKHFPSSGLPI
jgi:hypothetical protein